MTYYEKLQDPRWQKKRLAVMNRDNFTCRDCGATDKTLHVHHCHYDKGGPWATDERLLLTLCNDCHERRGALEAEAKRALAIIMARTPSGDVGDLYGLVATIEYAAINYERPFMADERAFQEPQSRVAE